MIQRDQPQDMFAMWQEWGRVNEQTWSRMLGNWFPGDQFAQALGPGMETYAWLQRTLVAAVQQYAEQTLRAMNIASTADIAQTAETVVDLEKRVNALAGQINALSAQLREHDVADRLSALEQKLDSLAQAVESVAAEVRTAAASRSGSHPVQRDPEAKVEPAG